MRKLGGKYSKTSIYFFMLLVVSFICFSNVSIAGVLYQNGAVSGNIEGATITEVLEQISSASGKSITIEGAQVPQMEINVKFNNLKLDKAIKQSLSASDLKNYNVVYDIGTPELSSAIRIILTSVFTPINEKTVNGYLNKKLGSRALLKWEPDAIALFEEAMEPVPTHIKEWVLRTLMSHIEADSEKIRLPKITKEMVADILRNHTPESDKTYLEQQINSFNP